MVHALQQHGAVCHVRGRHWLERQRTVVFGLSQGRMKRQGQGSIPPRFRDSPTLQSLLAALEPPLTIRGPMLEAEALRPHLAYLASKASTARFGQSESGPIGPAL